MFLVPVSKLINAIVMHLSIIFVSLIIVVDLSYANLKPKPIWEVVDLSAVTNFENLEEFFRKTYQKITYPKVPYSKKQTRTIKQEVCRRIFSSAFYNLKGEYVLDTENQDSRLEIKKQFTNSYSHVFESVSNCVLVPRTGDGMKYVNSYRELPIRFPDKSQLKEYIFSCFTKNRDTQEISQYFVSKDYNVAKGMRDETPMAARFIFLYNPERGLYVVSMAEEASAPNLGDVLADPEIDYLKFRADSQPCEKEELDPVCVLSHTHKLRLCASVFASKIFDNKMIFEPVFENVEENCAWKEVSFSTNPSIRQKIYEKFVHRKNLERDQTQHEWMFSCKVLNVAKSRKAELIYVSMGDRAHTVFLYSHKYTSDDRLFVLNSMKNVSVVDARVDDNADMSETPTENKEVEDVEIDNVPQGNPSESVVVSA